MSNSKIRKDREQSQRPFIPDPTKLNPQNEKSTRRLRNTETEKKTDPLKNSTLFSRRNARTSPQKSSLFDGDSYHGERKEDVASFYDPKKGYESSEISPFDPKISTIRRNVTPEKKRDLRDSVLHSVTNLSNSKYNNKEKTVKKLVERRNSNYSYDGRSESFLSKIVNNDFFIKLEENPGLEKYINQCRVQIATAKDLKMYMLTQPFMGVSVDLIPRTDSNF